MKLDVEGSEIEVVSDLILTGAFQHVDAVMTEWHPWLAGNSQRK